MAGADCRDLLRRTGHLPAHPPDRRDQLSDGVLGSDRVSQDRGIHRAFPATAQHPGLLDDILDRIVDPVRPLRCRQPSPPIHQRRRIKPCIVQRHPGRDLPSQITPRRLGGLPIREIMQALQHQDRPHHRRRDRWPALTRTEKVLEHHIREQILPMPGQELEHAALSDQMTHQSLRVQQLPVRSLHTLHRKISKPNRRTPHTTPDYSAAS